MRRVRNDAPWFCLLALLFVVGCNAERGPKDWSEHTHGLPFVVGYERGSYAAQQNGKPRLFLVTTTTCESCKKMAAESFSDPKIQTLLDQFQLILIDGQEERAAARKLEAEGYPHIVLQSPTGETLAVLFGYHDPASFQQVLEEALASMRS